MHNMHNDSTLAYRHHCRARGFTLIEIMVVVVIMGILAALIVPKLMGRTDDARIIAARQDIATVMQALKLYKLDNQRYPTTEQGLQALIVNLLWAPLPTAGKPVDTSTNCQKIRGAIHINTCLRNQGRNRYHIAGRGWAARGNRQRCRYRLVDL